MTLAIEEELLQAARAVAAERQTSVNEMVRSQRAGKTGESEGNRRARVLSEDLSAGRDYDGVTVENPFI
ncbi:MAG TPA: hypothetical protein VKM72_15360 [Thermoanaerobaculia bacterium]|nr:hypothetical protein [Thermoanaerobaculia bacterium]